jgi:hypothetical protein
VRRGLKAVERDRDAAVALPPTQLHVRHEVWRLSVGLKSCIHHSAKSYGSVFCTKGRRAKGWGEGRQGQGVKGEGTG